MISPSAIGDYVGEGRDLLHDAITRVLTSRSCREDITGEQSIAGIMRSIASTARRSRERRAKDPVLPAEQMAVGGYTVLSADDIIETERVHRSAPTCSTAWRPRPPRRRA